MPSRDQWDPSPGLRLPIPARPVPSAILALAGSAARRVPLLGSSLQATERELSRVESLIWAQVRHRMAQVTPGDASDDVPQQEPGELLNDLLTDAIEISATEARRRLYRQLLGELHPDEARILAALSDGTTYPVVHVHAKGSMGTPGARVLANASTVGRSAGIALPDRTPYFVGHLRRLGLVTLGPESREHADDYEVLMTESFVRAAARLAGGPTRESRHTLVLTDLGTALWQACQHTSGPAER